MLTWLFVALGVALASSLCPLVSAELFVIAFAARHPHLPVVIFGAVLAIGQVAGKLLYYYAARGKVRLPALLRPREKSETPRGPAFWHTAIARLRVWWTWLRIRCRRYPKWMVAATATSALVGVPPFLAMTMLAGLAGLSLRAFVGASLPPRFARFTLLAAAPGYLHWLPLLHHLH